MEDIFSARETSQFDVSGLAADASWNMNSNVVTAEVFHVVVFGVADAIPANIRDMSVTLEMSLAYNKVKTFPRQRLYENESHKNYGGQKGRDRGGARRPEGGVGGREGGGEMGGCSHESWRLSVGRV